MADDQETGTSSSTNTSIVGVVKDINTGATISGATITNGSVSTTTNSNGAYTLNVAAGKYTLYAMKPGYLKTSQICTVTSGANATVNWSLTKSYGTQPIPAANMSYTVLAWNDLGMHCDQDDYSYFMVLPPYNTLHAQVFKRDGGDISTGVKVSYAFPKKTNSALHTNFWDYASQYGFNVPANVGISGTPLAGDMKLDSSGRGYVAEGIPITSYDDDGTWDPYGTATITVKDSSGKMLQTADVVAPVSTEMMCSNCHGTTNPQLDILKKHDARSGTTLAADQAKGIVHACAECHADNALGAAGKPGVENLSLAMHKFHAQNASIPATTDGCYNCHPGPKTNCLRGIMSRAGKGCVDCHGDIAKVASSIENGHQPWLNEPKCADCHDSKHQENDGTLYRFSVLQNALKSDMNNKIYCEACHNRTHAEYTTAINADTSITKKFQGDNYWIWNCTVCHSDESYDGQTMHR